MTEEEWLACTDPDQMGWFIRHKRSDRKWRLLAVECCRRIWHLITEDECRRVVEIVEQYADGSVCAEEMLAVAEKAVMCGYRVHHDPFRHRAYAATDALGRGVGLGKSVAHSCGVSVGHAAYAVGKVREIEMRFQSILLRDIFGNPFRPISISPAWLAWKDGTVVKVAQRIYDDRTFDRLPILADALEEAGCDNTEILGHCRGPGPHVKGCWLVDLLLGKE